MDFYGKGPIIVGGIGGSGTRLVVEILRVAGGYMGRVNASNDSRYMGTFIRRWLRIYLAGIDQWKTSGDPEAMIEFFHECLGRHVENLPSDAPFWGWKNPPNIFLLPFLQRHCSGMRFIHVIRDGRDMAFSKNQYDLRNYGDLILKEDAVLRFWNRIWRLFPRIVPYDPKRAIALWSAANTAAWEYGQTVLGDRYLLVSYENLCSDARAQVSRICRFVGRPQAPLETAVAQVKEPQTIGRWRDYDRDTLDRICRFGKEGLAKFGY